MQQDSSMGEQRRKAWQKFPNAHSGSAIVPRPRRIILIRHGESLGNIDEVAYTTTPDWKIPLTRRGRAQAADVGAAHKINTQLSGLNGCPKHHLNPL